MRLATKKRASLVTNIQMVQRHLVPAQTGGCFMKERKEVMNKEELLLMSKNCEAQAQYYYNKGEKKLFMFYSNAQLGFRLRAEGVAE